MVIGNFQPLNERIDRGMLNENFTAGQLLKSGYEIKYWRTKSHAEIDFVLEEAGANITIVEVKSFLSTNKPAGRYSTSEKISCEQNNHIVGELFFF